MGIRKYKRINTRCRGVLPAVGDGMGKEMRWNAKKKKRKRKKKPYL